MLSDIKVPMKEAGEYAAKKGLYYFETSAKEGTNVNEMF